MVISFAPEETRGNATEETKPAAKGDGGKKGAKKHNGKKGGKK